MRIQDLRQPVNEGRDAPVFHWVDHKKLVNILSKNSMPARFTHTLPETNQQVTGNSMSRNPKFYAGDVWKIARLTFSQSKLAHTHKIIPLDADVAYRHGSGEEAFVTDRGKEHEHEKLINLKMAKQGTLVTSDVMAEEFVIGDIEPLNIYLIEIFVFDAAAMKKAIPMKNVNHEQIVAQVDEYGKQYGIPVTNRFKR